VSRPTFVVTGANSGIGKAMSTALAKTGATVVMVARSAEKGEKARADVKKESRNDDVHLERADLGSLDEVRDLASRLVELERIDALLNNAGVYLPERMVSPDGLEMMLAVNHYAPFLLTHLLRPKLAQSKGRVVTTASIGHRFCRFDLANLQAEAGFTPFAQYGVTKLANILFTSEAARRFGEDEITANCFHPGAVATGFAQDEPGYLNGLMQVGRSFGHLFLRSPEKGGATGVYLATHPSVADVSGLYFVDERPRRPSKTARDRALAERLWEHSLEVTGLSGAADVTRAS